jgi:hypothetical protein
MFEKKVELLYNAIHDSQQTIRAIDIKLQIILAILVLPLQALKDFSEFIISFKEVSCGTAYQSIFYFFLALFGVSYILSMISCLRGIAGLSSPVGHILIGDYKPKGIFYLVSGMKLGFWDSIFNLKSQTVKPSLEDVLHISNQLNNEETISRELVFENLKLTYIRDIKLFRINFAIKLMVVSILSLAIILMMGLEKELF